VVCGEAEHAGELRDQSELGSSEDVEWKKQRDVVDLTGDGPALAGLGSALAGVPALAVLRYGFSRFGLFREILRELFVNLGGN
jgi:hypothetical protein